MDNYLTCKQRAKAKALRWEIIDKLKRERKYKGQPILFKGRPIEEMSDTDKEYYKDDIRRMKS